MQRPDPATLPHRRKNLLTGEWVLVSPHRTQRPWQGEFAPPPAQTRPEYDPTCYLCAGNVRANGERNPKYDSTFAFTNDFPALLPNAEGRAIDRSGLLVSRTERGICRVVNYSPRHDLTLADMSESDIVKVVETWQSEMRSLASDKRIRHVQIFENKGSMMGNSNPHPHCQIWAQESIPLEPQKELAQCRAYFARTKRPLLMDYVKLERRKKERVVFENDSMTVLVPFWAVWPFETMIIPRRRRSTILDLNTEESRGLAHALRRLTRAYDALFSTSFPYSSGLHQAPTDGRPHPEWHLHMHFYPPLLRSATVKKFMVGYELLAEPQRDITPEQSAIRLREVAEDLPTT